MAAAAAALAEPTSLAGTLRAAGPAGLLALLRGQPGAPRLGEAGAAAMRAAPAPSRGPIAPPPLPRLSPADAAALRAACDG